MRKLMNQIWVLYVVLMLLFGFLYNKVEGHIKILNFYRNSARYINSYAMRGDLEFDRKKFYEASLYQERLLKVASDQTMSYGVLGYVYNKLGEDKKAIKAYKNAIEAHGDLFGYHYNLGLLYYNQRKWDKAFDAFQKSVDVGPEKSVEYHQKVAGRMFKSKKMQLAWLSQKVNEMRSAYERSKVLMLSIQQEQRLVSSELKDKLYYYIPLIETGIIPLKPVIEGTMSYYDK